MIGEGEGCTNKELLNMLASKLWIEGVSDADGAYI